MSMEYVRKTYGVPAKRGGRVIAKDGMGRTTTGTITGARSGYLRIRLDGWGYSQNYHPTTVEYLPATPEGAT